MAVIVTRTTTLFTDTDGDLKYDPGEVVLVHIKVDNITGADLTNLDIFDTQNGITIDPLTVKITPIALDDNLGSIVGNTPYVVTASQLLGNDVDPDGPEASLVIASFSSLSHVSVTNLGGGNYQIVPETGYQGAAGFDYTITDAQGLNSVSTGHVSLTISGLVWYVDSNAATTGGDGSYLNPFKDLNKLNGVTNDGTTNDDVDGNGDTIFVYNRGATYSGGITLETNQKLYGDGHEMTVNGFAIGAAGVVTNSTIGYSGGATSTAYGVTLASGNTIEGLDLTGTNNTGVGIRDGGTSVGSLNISNVSVTGNGQAVDIDNGGSLNVTFNTLSSTTAAVGTGEGNGVHLSGDVSTQLSGTFTANAGTISGAAGYGFEIGDGNPGRIGALAVTYGGNISGSGNSEVFIDGTTGTTGNITFSGSLTHSAPGSGSNGITMNHIAGGTIAFSGAMNLGEAGTGQGISIAAQSAGSVTFSGGNIAINTVNGTGISVGGMSGGTFDLAGGAAVTATGTGIGVNLTNNTAGAISFTGGGLQVSSKNGTAFVSNNSSAVSTTELTVSGASNTITTSAGGTGSLVDILNTKIGANGIKFDSIAGNSTGVASGAAISVNNLDKTAGTGTFDGGTVTVYSTASSGDGIKLTDSSADFTFASATIGDNTHNVAGDGIEVGGATGNVTFTTATINNTTGNGVFLNAATGGAVAINGGAIGNVNDPAADSVNVTGGNSALTVAATVFKNTVGNVVDISGHSGGTIAFSNTVTSTNNGVVSSNGISLVNNTGGAINFTNNVTLNTGVNDAFTFTNTAATGANVTIGGGTLDVDANGAGRGIYATSTTVGAGSLTITGANNTIDTANGVALNVDDVRIGSSGLTFKSVNVTDASSYGIFLDNTGTTAGTHGGLTITGDAGSSKIAGGTISAADNAGISISNARDIVIDQMTVQNGLDDGIRLSSVVNFSLTQSAVTNNGNALNEHGVDATNVTGTVRVTDVTLTNNEHEQFHYTNDAVGATSADIEFNNVDFKSTGVAAAPNGSHGINLTADGASSMDLRVVNGSDFDNLFSNSIQAQNEGTGTLEVTIANATFTNVGAGAINIAQNDSGTVRFNIHDNGTAANPTFLKGTNNATSHSININQAGGTPAGAILEGKIDNNFIGNSSSQDSASAGGAGIRVFSVGSGTTNVVISNNTIKGVLEGILVSMGEDANAAHTVNATIFNNNVSVTNVLNGFEGIAVVAGTQSGDVGVLRLDMHDNTAGSASSGGNTDFMVRQRFLTTIEFLNLGGANNSVATVQNYLDNTRNNNPNGPNTDWFITENSGSGGGGFDSTAAVPQPTLPSPLMVAPQGMLFPEPTEVVAGEKPVGSGPVVDVSGETGGSQPPSDSVDPASGPILPADGGEILTPPLDSGAPVPATVVDDGIVSQAELNLLVAEAIDRWAAAGATPEQLAAMRAVRVSVTDMMGVQIGGASPGAIQIDNDGAGYGWFVDSTPGDDSEFTGAGTRLAATPGGAAAGHIDLLTVLMHELGHQIGLDDSYLAAKADDLMYGYVNVGERRTPASGEAAAADGQAPDHEAFLLSPVANVGTLPAGKSVDIQFQATINAVTNQVIVPINNNGTAKYDPNVTVDSNTEVMNLDTLTLGDRVYIDANANGFFDAGEGKNGVALTLFADSNNNGVLDIGTDVQLATTTTAGVGAAVGSYSFASLAPGNYIVRVDASNFNVGGALAGTRGIFGGVDPDGDAGSGFNVDNDDNGVAGPAGSIVASPITLAYNSEPNSDGGAIPKNDVNNSLDFGFVVNTAPTANADAVSATEDQASQYSTELTGNDTDADLDTLTITSVSNFVNGSASVASGIVTFTPTANFNGTASFDYTISDGNGHTATATATVTVGAVNDPVTTNAPLTASLNEDAANSAIGGLSISDVDSTAAPAGVYEVTLSATHGTMTLTTLTGLTFSVNDGTGDTTMTFHGTLSDINTALATAKYSPDLNYNGPAQITLQATDSFNNIVASGTGTATNDSDVVAVTVNSVNDAPQGTDDSSNTTEGLTYTFAATDFTDGFSDPVEGNAFQAVVITQLPTVGTLKLNGTAILAGATITLADLTGNLFTYVTAAGSGGTAQTFKFAVQDNGGVANGGVDTDTSPNTYTMNVASPNAAPVLDLDGNDSTSVGTGAASSYSEGGAAAAVADTDISITDADSGDDIVSAIITITNSETGDTLNVGSLPAGITLDPSSTATMVKLAGIAGTTADDMELAIKAVTFSSTSDDPTDHGTNLARSITVVVNDGVINSNTATATIAVTDVNDGPSGTSSTITAVEDTFRLISQADLGFGDVDGTFASVTISGVTGGKIYVDSDGTAGANDPLEATLPVTFTAQDLLDGKASFKADPNTNGSGIGTITFAVTDDDGATDGTPDVLTVDVTAVNDSPMLSASLPINATEQTPIYILGGVTVSDVDLDARNTGGDYSGAVFSISRDGGSNPEDDFEVVGGGSFTRDGINLKVGGLIFGHISTDANGVIAITFTSLEAPATSALVDEVIQSIRYFNTSNNPPPSVQLAYVFNDGSPLGGQGTGALATDTELVTVAIAGVNDAPVNALGGTIGTGEDAIDAWLSGMSISDPDADPANDKVVVTFHVAHGTLDIDTGVAGGVASGDVTGDDSGTVVVTATLNQIKATLDASNGLTYTPDLNFNGDDTLTVTTNDQGHNGTDPLLTGNGSSEEDVDTRTISVSAVDDAPVVKDDAISTPENVAKTGSVFDDNGSGADTDVDSPLVVSAVGGGTLGVPFALGSGAMLTVNSNGSYTYDPAGQFNYLVAAASGAVNTSATDSFTYTLQGGGTATVTVTITGATSAGDIYRGDGTGNTITTAGGNDIFDVSQGGNDTVSGNDGDDYFYFGNAFTTADTVDGGNGTDVVALLGNYNMTLGASSLVNIERLTLISGTVAAGPHVTYAITTIDDNVGDGKLLTVLGTGLASDETMLFNGGAETDGSFYIAGGAADDILVGGQKGDSVIGGGGNDQLFGLAGADWLEGGAGADSLRGGTGADLFVYRAATDSTGASTDHIFDFEATTDLIDLSNVDANSGLGGDQAFSFIGSDAFHNVAGELRAYFSAGSWWVEGDTDGNGAADIVIQVDTFGGHIMAASDFVL